MNRANNVSGGVVSVGTSVVLAVNKNDKRIGLILMNNGSNDIYVGFGLDEVSSSNAHTVLKGGDRLILGNELIFCGDVYVIGSDSTSLVYSEFLDS